MSLSKKTQEILTVALANKVAAKEMIVAFDSESALRAQGDVNAIMSATAQDSQNLVANRKQILTWSAADVANQYKDLRFWSANDSMRIDTAGVVRLEGTDYTVSVPSPITITCVADVSASLQNKSMQISSSTVNYLAWFNVDGTGVAPTADANAGLIVGGTLPVYTGVARTLVPVAITSNSSAATIATALFNALVAIGALNTIFEGSVSGAVVTVSQVGSTAAVRNLLPPSAGNTGFTVTLAPINSFSRINLKPGGALATGGSAAIVAGNTMVCQYGNTQNLPFAADLSLSNLALYPASAIAKDATLPATISKSFYYKMGRGAPIVYITSQLLSYRLHGSGTFIRDLSERYTVHATNLPYQSQNSAAYPDDGHGYSFDMLVNNSIDFIVKLNVGPVHLMGYAGAPGLQLRIYQLRPDLVRSLVMIDPYPNSPNLAANIPSYINDYDAINGPIVTADAKLAADESYAMLTGTANAQLLAATQDQRNLTSRKFYSEWFSAVPSADAARTFTDGSGTRTYMISFATRSSTVPSAAVSQEFIDAALSMNYDFKAAYAVNATQIAFRASDLAAIKVPTLILKSSVIQPYINLSANAMAALIPGATLTTITDTFSNPPSLNPADSADAIFKFLATLS